jgi:uncharacterized protein YbaP (TraB family)
MKRILSLLLALFLTAGGAVPALAAGEDETGPRTQAVSPWAYDALADIYALGLWNDDYYYCILDTVTPDQLDQICAVVADKLALLNLAPDEGGGGALVIDCTRGGVKNALFQEAAAYEAPFAEADEEFMLRELGVAYGDGTGNDLNARPCTLQEALVMASRLVLSLYDYYNAGSLGFLWKAEGNGVTLYMLGSIHVDRDNIYPFHSQLRSLFREADGAVFEVDFNDLDDALAYTAMQVYRDGTTLKDHIGADLYAKVVAALTPLGLTEDQTALYKPWALANTFQALANTDESTGESMMAVDLYCNAAAVNAGVPGSGVETYVYQGGIFDQLSPEYQEAYLQSALDAYLNRDAAPAAPEASDSADLVELWTEQWKNRDIDGFAASYDKDEILSGGDELSARLFTDRDPNMVQYAASLLKNADGAVSSDDGGDLTYVMVVGAGHMIGYTGIVQGLRDMGFLVEAVPAP